jgi:hypothetical protein
MLPLVSRLRQKDSCFPEGVFERPNATHLLAMFKRPARLSGLTITQNFLWNSLHESRRVRRLLRGKGSKNMSIKTSNFKRSADHNDLAPLSGDADHAASRRNLKSLQGHEQSQAIDQDGWSNENRTVGGNHTAQSLSDHLASYNHQTVTVHDGSQDGKSTIHRTSKTSDEL